MSKLYFKVASDWQEVVRLRNEISKLEAQIKSMDANKAPQAVAVLNNQMQQAKHQMNGMITEAAKAGAVMDNDFKSKIYQGSQSVNDFTQKIINQKAVVKDVETDVRRLGESYRSALKNNPLSASGKLSEYTSAKKVLDEEKAALFGLQTEQAQARLSVRKLKDEYSLYQKEGQNVVDSNNQMALSFKKTLAAIGGTAMIKKFVSDVLRIRGEFQQLDVAFTTLLQSKEKANALMAQMVQTAAKTPFNLTELATGARQLVAYGFQAEEINGTLIRLGNIASGLGLPLERLTYLYGTTMTQGRLYARDLMQFTTSGIPMLQGLADMYGVSTAKVNEMVTAGKIGFPEVQKVVENLTNEGGKFFNLMEEQSKTITGKISNLGDAMDGMFNSIGQANEGVINDSIDGLKYLVENYEQVGRILLGLVATYGTYRTALLINSVLELGSAKAVWTKITATKAATLAQATYNKVLAMNPYVAVGMAVVSLGVAMWALRDNTSAAEKAAKDAAKTMENMADASNKLKNKINELLSIIKDETATQYDKASAYLKLQKIMPDVFKNMDIEKLKLMDELSLREKINEAANRSNIVEAKTNMVIAQRKYDASSAKYKKDTDNGLVGAGSLAEKNESFMELEAAKKVVSEIEKIQSEANKQKKKGGEKVVVENKEFWEKQKKDAETALDTIDSKQRKLLNSGKFDGIDASVVANYKAQSKLLKEAQNELKIYDTTGKYDKQQESAAEKLRKEQESIREQQEKNAQLEKKHSLDRQRQQQDLEHQAAQAEIDALDDSFEKKEKQRALNNKKEIQALERQKDDYIRAVIQFEKEKFDAQEELNDKNIKGYNKKTFDSSTVKVDSSAFNGIINNTSKKQLNDKVREQEDSWNEYLIKFGDYQQKRKAIIEKYDKLIKEAEDAGKMATYEKDKQNAVDDLDNSIKNSSTLMGQLFADASQKSVSEIQKVIEKAELLMQYLESVKDEKGNAQIGGKTVSKKDILGLGVSDNTLQNLGVSTEEVEALRNAISKLKGELGSKSPFILFKNQVDSAIDKINQGGNKNIAQGITEIGGAIASFSPVISQFGQDLGNIFGSDDLGNKIAGVSDALGGVGQTAAGVGQIMSGDIVGGVMSAVSGISSVVSALDGLFGADYSHYNEMKEQYETISTIWDELIDKKTEYLEISTTEERKRAEQEILDIINKKEQAARNLGLERLNAGSSAGSSSIGVRIRKGMGDEGWSQWDNFANSIGMNPDDIGGRLEGLFSLTNKQLEDLKGNAPDFWAKLDDDVRTYLEDIIKCGEQTEETTKKTEGLWAGMSFDSMVDKFRDALSDMDSSTADFADDFQQYMINAMIDSFVNGEVFQKKLNDWHKKLAEYSQSDKEITKEEKDELQKDWDTIVKEGTDYRDSLFESMGFSNSKSTSQNSTNGGFQTMSQDEGKELNGRFTALQIAGEEIKNQNILQSQSLNLLTFKADAILSVNTEVRNIADETRTILANSYLELVQISENTGESAKYLKEIKSDIAEVKKNTKAMAG